MGDLLGRRVDVGEDCLIAYVGEGQVCLSVFVVWRHIE